MRAVTHPPGWLIPVLAAHVPSLGKRGALCGQWRPIEAVCCTFPLRRPQPRTLRCCKSVTVYLLFPLFGFPAICATRSDCANTLQTLFRRSCAVNLGYGLSMFLPANPSETGKSFSHKAFRDFPNHFGTNNFCRAALFIRTQLWYTGSVIGIVCRLRAKSAFPLRERMSGFFPARSAFSFVVPYGHRL